MIGHAMRSSALALLLAVVLAGCYRISPSGKAASSSPSSGRVVSGTKEDGVHDQLSGELAGKLTAGWAWDPSRPDTPISVDIYDGDRLIATVLADRPQEGLAKAGIGNGQHVFVYRYPPSMHDGKEHTIRVRISGSDIDLRQTPHTVLIPVSAPETASPKPAPPSASSPEVASGAKEDGVHDQVDGNLAGQLTAGWAWDPSRPDTPISVNIYDGDKLIATVLADTPHEGLAKVGIGNGKHVFTYRYPPSMHDGKEHTIRVRISGSNINLRRTPRKVVIPELPADRAKNPASKK